MPVWAHRTGVEYCLFGTRQSRASLQINDLGSTLSFYYNRSFRSHGARVQGDPDIRIRMGKQDVTNLGRRTYRRHDYQERMAVVRLHEKGLGSKQIARAMNLDDSMVRLWLRKYRVHGEQGMHPYWREAGAVPSRQSPAQTKEEVPRFRAAMVSYATSLEPVASIARRHGVEYHSFKYYVERYHPELVAKRKQLNVCVSE